MENVVVFHDNLPETDQLARLVVLLVHCLQRPVDPAGCLPLPRVPVGNQDIQCLLNQGSYFIITLTQAFEPPDESEVEPQGFIGVEPFEGANVVTGPYESIVLDDFILNSEESPDGEYHSIPVVFVEDVLDGAEG